MIRRFLLADDDQDDTLLFQDALREVDSSIELSSASNGLELLANLKSEKVNPHIIFLDINMPEMNGWETLQAIKADSSLSSIPVIMYSTSSSSLDGKKAVASGALCFYEKPSNFLKLKDFLRQVAMSDQGNLEEMLDKIIESKAHKIYS